MTSKIFKLIFFFKYINMINYKNNYQQTKLIYKLLKGGASEPNISLLTELPDELFR